MRFPQVWAIAGLMALTAALISVRGDVDQVPASVPLAQIPETIDGLKGTDIPLDPGTLEVLGKGVFLNRTYHPEGGQAPAEMVGLFIGYFPTQRTGQSIHSPQNCLPGSGWTFESSGVTQLQGPLRQAGPGRGIPDF